MKDIFEAKFEDLTLRFVVKDGDLFVSKDDLFTITKRCFTPRVALISETMMEKALELLTDSIDRRSAIIGKSSIGCVLQFHAAGNILSVLADLTDIDEDNLRETAFRVSTLFVWYASILTNATRYFGITFMDSMHLVKKRLDRINPPFIVDVLQEDGGWVAVCDKLHLVTEADSYEKLTERAWEIAEDLYIENGLGKSADRIRLSFRQEQSNQDALEM